MPIPEAELGMWIEQMAIDPMARSFQWRRAASRARRRSRTSSSLVIGAGMGGLNAAVQLKRAGIPFVVVEKNAGVGGTWYENRYPGARVDTPSRNYTHSSASTSPTPTRSARRTENQEYFDWVADTFDLRDDIEFNTEVNSMIWDEDGQVWTINAAGPDGDRSHGRSMR